ncbi:lysophospholipid acyltransferase family protein [Spiribacter halobius]|uniref:1-acyl-sn-glycerol-3-phosphate acyltransferase n=1 Tax=Sediminicurvatus halobius TaxID=2182432 RepID=A0A2U2N2E3_9GAMM|nr:lysophospholipid acyltransferase family protein [Spiribacter halobius]PWG63391.1 1-acyl-sn-glycerol-3-phosphate acyltransferase [Spiribacter halobius]UEX78061.1 1-acyl-sn-glycerol-3-phosphate acyltransferase [Spiribacter halobius]
MATSARGSLARGLLFQTGMMLSILVWGVVSLLLSWPLPYRRRYWLISRWCPFMWWWLERVGGVGFRVEGLEHIPETPAVVLSKHQSTWETVNLVRWFHPQTWVLKRELMWLPIFGWALALLEPIAIDRAAGRDAMRQVVEQGRARLRAGRWVVVFPEGTRIPAGRRGRYRLGGAVLACEAGVPVVPVAHNAGEHWPRRGLRLRPGTVNVRIGQPIPTAGRDAMDVLTEAQHWIEQQMPELSRFGYSGELVDRHRAAG